jgi:hypothetical protein
MSLRSVLTFCLFSAAAFSQDYRATLTGTVTDPSGAAVPNASVKATNTGTNAIKEVKTTSDGVYTIPYLDPGVYDVEVTAAGFQQLKRSQITLQVAQKMNLPLQMTVGQMTQEITVTGQQEVIDTADASRGLVFDPIKTQEYPLNGRQTYMLMSLTPGVVFTQEQFGASGFSGTRGWDVNNSYKINGARTGENLFLLNGAPISNNGGTWQLAPNVEAVQEFKVMTNTYDSSFGRFGGGVVNTTLKSGTNSWNGDVFDYWRNSIMDANFFQNNSGGLPKGFHNQHQFGGVAGGPIRKNRDFIFGSFEGWQEVVPFPANSTTVPTVLRDGQHFTDMGYKIFDPLTAHVCNTATENCQGQTYIQNPFPGNVIPQNRISPVGAKIVSYFPAENKPGLITQNYVAASNLGRYWYNQPMIRWDHSIGANDKFYALFTYQQGHEYRSIPGFPRPAATGNTNNERNDKNVIADWTHVLSSTTVLDVRASFGRFIQTTPGYSDFSINAKTLGMSGFTPAPTSPGDVAPSITLGNYSAPILSSGTAFSWNSYNQYNFTPSVTTTRGAHAIRAGFELNYVTNGNVSTGSSNGIFTFNASWTQQLPARQQNTLDGSSVATLLLGYPTSGSIAYNDTQYRSRPYYGLYVQDDWKVTSRLTLNIGLRYDVQVPWLERYDRENRGWDPNAKQPQSDAILANWAKLKSQYDAQNPTAKYKYPDVPAVLTGGFVFPGVNGMPRRLYDTDWKNIQPRFGFAYRIGDKTVLRGGAGIYYQSSTQSGTTTGFTQSTPYTSSLDGGITPSAGVSLNGPYSLVNPFPNGFAAPTGNRLGAQTNLGNGVSYDPPGFSIPRTYQYSFAIQRQFWHNIVAEISYAGNYQNHINFGQNLNHETWPNQRIAIDDTSYYSRTVPNPFFGFLPVTSALGQSSTIAANNLFRPDPIYQGITNNLIQQGWYRSDQMQVRIEQRAFGNSAGGGKAGVLTWVLSYAFGKAFEANHRLNDWNTLEPVIKEIDNTDKAQNLTISGVWDLPLGHDRRFLNVNNPVARLLADNWRVAPILSYASGNPTGMPNLINKCGNDWHSKNQNEDSWIENSRDQTSTAAVKPLVCYAQLANGNVLRTNPDRFSDIRDPSVGPFINLAIEKTMPIHERYRLQFRAESFNLSNHPQRPGPDTSFTSATFGQLPKSQLNFPRLVQLAAKFYF